MEHDVARSEPAIGAAATPATAATPAPLASGATTAAAIGALEEELGVIEAELHALDGNAADPPNG